MSLSSVLGSVAVMGAPMLIPADVFSGTVRTVVSPSVKTGGNFMDSITSNRSVSDFTRT